MENSALASPKKSIAWYLVCLHSGSAAVVSSEDLSGLIDATAILSAVLVSDEVGRNFEQARARAADMSANHRIKAGDSGGGG